MTLLPLSFTSSSSVRKFFGKLLLLSLPFLAWLAYYCAWDPYSVLRDYPQYEGRGIAAQRDFVSTEFLLRDHRKFNYNSFILGNSRTLGIRSGDWAAYLPSGSSIFSYGSDSDNLFGIAGKVVLLDSLGLSIQNALVLFDNDSLTGTEDARIYFARKHPRVSQGSMWRFQLDLARTFFKFHPPKSNLRSKESTRVRYAPVTNDIILQGAEERLAVDEAGYYRDREGQLTPKPEVEWGSVIVSPAQRRLLEKMAAIFKAHGTHLTILLPPQLSQIHINPKDVAYLRELFGKDCVYDFSAASEFSQDPRNWYDAQHFRPHVGRRLLREIYGARWFK